VLAAITALPAAWVYAYIRIHAPLPVHFFFAFLFAIWLGISTKYIATHGKVRNSKWIGKLGLLIGLMGWYVQWVAYSAIILQDSRLSSGSLIVNFTHMAANPTYPAAVAAARLHAGAGEIAGWHIGGWAFVISWLIELCTLLGVPYLLGRARASEPFCERSGTWAKPVELPGKFAFIDPAESVLQKLNSDPEHLFAVLKPLSDSGPLNYSKVTLYRCSCGCDPFISVSNTKVSLTNQKPNETSLPFVNFLRLPGADPEAVIQRIAQLEPLSAATASSPGQDTAPELLGAINDLDAGRFEAALAAVSPYVHATQDNLRIDAVRLSAMATAHLGRWNESLSFWDALFNEEPTVDNALQVAASSAMAGDVTRGEEWIAMARQMNAASHEIPEISILTTFVSALTQCGQMKAALPYLDEIKNFYVSLGVTDSTYLYTRGVPFFGGFLLNSAAAIRSALGFEQGEAWYRSMLPHLDESGREELSTWLETTFIPETKAAGQ
jgi:hypothetical protein